MSQPISGVSHIIDRYDALLLDLWGVIHDGEHLYPGVKEVLTALRKANKKIIFISNAPRRAAKAASVLTKLGITREWYDNIVTSGEIGYRWLEANGVQCGKRYYYIGPFKDFDVLDGLDYQRVLDLKEADFLLNVGFGTEAQTTDDLMPLLQQAQALGLPMLCLNPDLQVVKISGERFSCAGVLAMDYEALGGKVSYFGKPYPEVYQACMEWLAPLDKSRILAVGDGIPTDIAGAVRFGVDCVLVTGGILTQETHATEVLCQRYNAVPNYIISSFAW